MNETNLSLWTATLAALGTLATVWHFRRKRRLRSLQESEAFYALCEQVIKTASPAEIATRLADALPAVIRGASAQLYLLNRSTGFLERVRTKEHPEPVVVPIEETSEAVSHAAAACFRDRDLLSIPDAQRSPLFRVSFSGTPPRSALLAPLLSKDETLGVLEIDNGLRVGYFPEEDKLAVQHLANQVTAALKLQQQQALRQQLFQGEKLAATGQLIAGVASELREPLENLSRLADSLAARHTAASPVAANLRIEEEDPAGSARALAGEARRAAEIVSRLVSFGQQSSLQTSGQAGAVSPVRVDLNAVLMEIAHLREPEWQTHDIQVQTRLSSQPVEVSGVEAQLAQVVLTLLVHAEQHAIQAVDRGIHLKTSILAGRALLEIGFSEPEVDPADDFPSEAQNTDTPAWQMCRGIVHQHHGEIRLRSRAGIVQIEIDLPSLVQLASAPATTPGDPSQSGSGASKPARILTLMVVDSDVAAARALSGVLGKTGHRVIPVPAEEALDLAQRIRFDTVFWAVRQGRSGLGEFQDRVQGAVDCFVLVSDAYDPELAKSMEKNGGFLLARPVQNAALQRILTEIGARASRN